MNIGALLLEPDWAEAQVLQIQDEAAPLVETPYGMISWRAGCVETRTPGSEDGPRKHAGRRDRKVRRGPILQNAAVVAHGNGIDVVARQPDWESLLVR